MDEREARARFAAASVARLATVRPDGAPHVVPVVFALDRDTVWLVVDEKPKRHRELQRLVNVRAEPRVSLLVDRYDEDWEQLWWVRADGRARIVGEGPELERAASVLLDRYPQERERPPEGPAIVVEVERWRYWPADRPARPRESDRLSEPAQEVAAADRPDLGGRRRPKTQVLPVRCSLDSS